MPVVTVPQGATVQGSSAQIAQVFQAVRTQLPKLRVVDLASTGDRAFVSDDGRSTFALVQGQRAQGFGPGASAQLEPVLAQAAAASGLQVQLTSYQLLAAGGDSAGPSVLVETIFGAVGALVVLLFVFASLLALVPLAIAAVSILTTFLLVLGLTYLTDVSFVVQFLISLIGLGVAIDYSLLLVSRWREERARGRDNHDAVVVAVRTAGHAVLASGVTVAISLLALLVVPVPFLRSMGLGGMLIPLVSVGVVLTLLPALLSTIGPRLDWPRIRHEENASRGWTAWARLVVRRRWIATGVAVLVLGLLIAPVFSLRIGQSGVNSLTTNGPAFDTVQTLRDGGVGTGVLTPIEVIVPQDQADGARAAAAGVEGVRTAVLGGQAGGTAIVDVLPVQETVDSSGTAVVEAVRGAVTGAVAGPVGITGVGATVADYGSAVYDNFPYVLLIIAAITFLLLVRTFRSVLLPLKAVVLNLVSLAAVFGTVVFFWQQGHGSRGAVRRVPHRRDHLLAAGDHLRVPVRAEHGLRGVHPGPDAGVLRRVRLHPHRGHRGAGADRTPGHVRRADPVLRLRGAGVGARDRHQGARHRPRRGHPDRRHHRARAAGARPGQPVRPVELVAARLAGDRAARGAVAAGPRASPGRRARTVTGARPRRVRHAPDPRRSRRRQRSAAPENRRRFGVSVEGTRTVRPPRVSST